MIAILLSLLFSTVHVDRVDMLERNCVYAEDTGALRGDYMLFWEFSDGEYRIRDWRQTSVTGMPCGNVLAFWDRKSKVHRWIEIRIFIESHLFFDREVENKKVWPENKRRKLTDERLQPHAGSVPSDIGGNLFLP